ARPHADSRSGSSEGADRFQERGSETFELHLSDSANFEELVIVLRTKPRHLPQSGVFENDVRGYSEPRGDLAPDSAQHLEEGHALRRELGAAGSWILVGSATSFRSRH